jgi:predicted Zn-dependent protease
MHPEEKSRSEERGSSRKWRRVACLVVLLGGAGVGGVYLWAWYHFRAAERALERYHGEEALTHLRSYLTVRPGSVAGLLLAGRAARRAGDLDAAEGYLRRCRRLHPGESEEIDLEWALLRVALGDLEDNEPYLLARAARRPQEAPLVWEALAEGYTRLYRVSDALRCLERWLAEQPDNPQALFLRGSLWWHIQVAHRAVPDYRRVLDLDPQRHEARRLLARCLVHGGGYDEALPLLEQALAYRPGDPEVLVDLARCEHMLGRPARARELLDGVLEEYPDDALALRTRGQLALQSGRLAEAETWLRRGARVSPTDYQVRYWLAQALRGQGKDREAAALARKADVLKDRRARLGEILTRLMAQTPNDPALHAELGTLLIELGHARVGESWLLSALHLDPQYGPAHAALADCYQARGDARRAAFHRRQAQVGAGRK